MNIIHSQMDEKTLIVIACIVLFRHFVSTQKSFKVDFQSSGVWSKDNTLAFKGKIPRLKEFTSCHWELDTYFSSELTNIWSYCFSEVMAHGNMKCIHFYHRGDRRVASRGVIFVGYFYGWTKIGMDVRMEVPSFTHRAWNHFCWTYSSLTGKSSLFYNGVLVAAISLPTDTEYPTISGTDDANKHLFVIGQQPNSLDGDYREDQALFGSISEFNLWDYVVDPAVIYNAANCMKTTRGNIISWEENLFDTKRSIKKNIQSIKELCEPKQDFVVFPESHSNASAREICASHGGTLLLPRSKSENQNIMNIMKKHHEKCVPSKHTRSYIEKLIWLGLRSSSRNWLDNNGDIIGNSNYTNWGSTFKELSKPGLSRACAFMTTDGSWAYANDECDDITLCFVCTIIRSTVLTLKGTCKLGSSFQWNFYPVVNSTNQISSFEGYKRGQQIVKSKGEWLLEAKGSKITLGKNVISPIGRNQWNWYERSCRSQSFRKRTLTLSLCRIGAEFTCDSGHCVELRNRCDNKRDCGDGSDERECTHVHIPEEYDKDDPPSRKVKGEDIIPIYIALDIEKINHIDTKNMLIQVTFCITIHWREPRIYFKNLDQKDTNSIDTIDSRKMWIPLDNLEHKNAVIGQIRPDLERKVEIVLQYHNKSFSHPEPSDLSASREEYRYRHEENVIMVEQRFRVDYECIFDLLKYPFDEQSCDIILKFRSLGNKKIEFRMTNDTITFKKSIRAGQLQVTNTTSNISSSCSLDPKASNPCEPLEKYVKVTKDAVLFTIHLKRAPLHHIKNIFLPCMGLWLIAYLTTLLRVNDFTNRNRISVTVLLALVTLFGATASTDEYPETTYLKYIDVWFLFYLANLLLVIIHHIAMEMLWHDPNKVVLANNGGVGDMYEGEARKEKRNKQLYLKKISTIFFPVTMTIFNVVYFIITT